MKIVCVIPTHNRAEHLKQLIPHVLKQGFYKIYVLDDASSDDSFLVGLVYSDDERYG